MTRIIQHPNLIEVQLKKCPVPGCVLYLNTEGACPKHGLEKKKEV